MHEKAEIINFGVNSNMLLTFYNAVICSLTVWFCLLGWDFSKFDRGRLEKIVKKKKKAGHVVGKPLDSFKTLHEKETVQKTNANIK